MENFIFCTVLPLPNLPKLLNWVRNIKNFTFSGMNRLHHMKNHNEGYSPKTFHIRLPIFFARVCPRTSLDAIFLRLALRRKSERNIV